MKRIGIMCIFSENGSIGESVLILAQSIKACTDKLVIAINGKIGKDIEKIQNITNEIYLRDNIGYDSGAYKDVLFQLYDRGEIFEYDELALVNDSFWGPLFPFDEMFDRMKTEKVDFWGITRSEAGRILDYEYPQHIQGYFVVMRKQVFIDDPGFCNFWKRLEYPKSYYEAVINYEIGISKWMSERGYKFSSYMDVQGAGSLVVKNRNVYLDYFDELVIKYRCPVLKKKAVSIFTYDRYLSLLNYLEVFSEYSVQRIMKEVELRDKEGKLGPYSLSELKEFCLSHDRIFVYGYGRYGKAIGKIIGIFCQKISYIVSDMNLCEDTPNVYEWGKVSVEPKDGIIVAVGKEFAGEISETVLDKIDRDCVILPRFN